jgi:hypothetical protein
MSYLFEPHVDSSSPLRLVMVKEEAVDISLGPRKS